MKQSLFSIGLALAIATAGAPCFAADAPDGAKLVKASYSVDSRISDLIANPTAAGVLRSFVQQQRVAAGKPELTAEQQTHMVQMIQNMTPREVARFPQVHLDDAGLSKLNALLAQIPAPPKA
jgi:hypothetical protein